MSQCPLCHAPVRDDFGLTECAECGAQLIVHMDGHVEYQGAVESVGSSVINVTDESPAEDFVPPSQHGLMPEEDFLSESAAEPVSEFESEMEPGSALEPESAPELEPTPEHEAATDPIFEPLADFDDAEPEPQEAVYQSAEVRSSPDLADVAHFGNSDLSGGREGPLRYNVMIEGIDTVDVREAFREAITDRKLMWDTDQILRSLRNGRVNISNVAPAKAHILINRLRGLPVQVRWEQYAISQT